MDLNFHGEKMVENLDNSVKEVCEVVKERCSREVEENRLAVELEIHKRIIDLEGVKDRIRGLEGEKAVIEEVIQGLENRKASLGGGGGVDDEMVGGGGISLDDEESRIDQVMIENKVLECERDKALKDVAFWKRKCQELESRVLELEGRVRCQASLGMTTNGHDGGTLVEGTSYVGTPSHRYVLIEDSTTIRVQPVAHVRRQLAFQNERNCDQKIAPSTPAGATSSIGLLIDVIDSDDQCGISGKHESFHGTSKRKRLHKVITSDDEQEVQEVVHKKRNFKIDDSDNKSSSTSNESGDDDDDNIPISQIMRNRTRGSSHPALGSSIRISSRSRTNSLSNHSRTRPRRRLVKSEQTETTVDVEDDEPEEDGSESDAGSLSSFIVDDSEIEDVEDELSEEDGSDTDYSYEPEGASDGNFDYQEIISSLGSRKNPDSEWALEGDMLSAFGRDHELCMRAVCALYRQQTTAEKSCKETLVQNGRGFSKPDAPRGTKLGEFLTGGDPEGDLVKSVKELQDYDPKGLKVCHKLARHYSKQLFEIYKNNEDPFFPSS